MAGHGDDDFVQITEEKARRILEMKRCRLLRGMSEVDMTWYTENERERDEQDIRRIKNKYPGIE
jgi:hypothetical protein